MEFTYSDYDVRLILNPSDIIVRFENDKTHRIWERGFVERDFTEFQALGGLEFVGRIMRLAFENTECELSIEDIVEIPKTLTFVITYENDILCKPIRIPITLPSIKRESASASMDDINKKLNALSSRIEELEEMNSGYIVLPGCGIAIPTTIPKLAIGSYGTTNPLTNVVYNALNTHGLNQNGYVYTHDGSLSVVNPLKYLKKCTELTLINATKIVSYSPIGSMTALTSLSIVTNTAEKCQLSDISWIASLTNLTEVCFYGCSNLKDISPLTKLKNLVKVDIRLTGVTNTSMLSFSIAITK